MSKEQTLAELEDEYRKRVEIWEDAKEAASIASRTETDALNRMNAAQKRLTAYMDGLLKSAPYQSEWGRERKERKGCGQA